MTEAPLWSTLLALPVLASAGVAPVQVPCEGWLTGPFWEKADPAAVRACLAAGYSVHDRSTPGERTPLHWAVRFSDDPDVIGVLVEAGAHVEAKTRARLTPLHWAARYNRDPAVVGALLDYGANAYAKTRHGRTPLHLAALVNENPAVVDALAGVTDVNVRKHDGGTPLHDAARRIRDGSMGHPNPAIVDVLIRRGADLSAETEGGLTPAGRARDERLAELLREEEALREAVRAQFLQSVALRCAVAVLVLGLLGYLVARFRGKRPRVPGGLTLVATLRRAWYVVIRPTSYLYISKGRMQNPIYKELVAASSRPLVLSILAGGDTYGYEIIKEVKRISGGDLAWSGGMLYPLLHRLEKDGLIEGYWEPAEDGRPRKYYTLTTRGRRRLATDRKSWRAVYGVLELSWRGGDVPAG